MSAGEKPAQWCTAIADVLPADVNVRGYLLSNLIASASYPDVLYLVLTGRRATPGQQRVIEAILVSAIEHGISPSSVTTRQMASYGVPTQVGVAAGLMTIGDYHGGAGEELARSMGEAVAALDGRTPEQIKDAAARLVEQAKQEGRRLDGFGHPQHTADPRVPVLLDLARDNGVFSYHCELLIAIEDEFVRGSGRRIAANIDGISAALLLDLGLDYRCARPLLMSARAIGLGAHFMEEQDQHGRWRHVPLSEVEYTGPPFAEPSSGSGDER